jgi:hypothetical protein
MYILQYIITNELMVKEHSRKRGIIMFLDFLVTLKIANLLHFPRVWRWCEDDPLGRNFLLTSNYRVVIFDFWLVIVVDLLCVSIQ